MSDRLEALRLWATGLKQEELIVALDEMRRRGWAVVAYESSDIADIYDVTETDAMRDWFANERGYLEERMSDSVRDYIWADCPDVGNE